MKTEIRAWFTLYGSFDPSDISRCIGVRPTRTWRAGDELESWPSLRREEDGWEYDSPISKDGTIDEHFNELLRTFYLGKEAVAAYPEIIKDIKLAIQDAGRKLAGFVRSQRKSREGRMRRQLFERYIPVVAESLEKLTGKDHSAIEVKLDVMSKSGKVIIEEPAADVSAGQAKKAEPAEDEGGDE